MDKYFTVPEAAEILRVTPESVRRWIRAKELTAYKLTVGEHGRIVLAESDIMQFLESRRTDADAYDEGLSGLEWEFDLSGGDNDKTGD